MKTLEGDKGRLTKHFIILEGAFFPIVYLLEGAYSQMMHSLGYSDSFTGVALSVEGIVALFLLPVAGYIADKTLKYRFMLTAALFTLAVVTPVFFGFYDKSWVAFGFTCIEMCIINTTINIIDSWVTKLKSQSCDVDYGRIRAIGSISYAVASVILSWIMEKLGYGSIIWMVLITAGISIYAVLALPNPTTKTPQKVSVVESAKVLFKNKNYVALLVCGFLFNIPSSAMRLFCSRLFSELGADVAFTGVAFFLMAGSEFVIIRRFTCIADKLGTLNILTLGMLGMGVKLLALAISPSKWLSLALMLLQAVSFGFCTPGVIRFVGEQIPEKYIASAILLFNSLGSGLAQILCSPIFGIISEKYSVRTMYACSSIPGFIAALIFWLYFRKQQKPQTVEQ